MGYSRHGGQGTAETSPGGDVEVRYAASWLPEKSTAKRGKSLKQEHAWRAGAAGTPVCLQQGRQGEQRGRKLRWQRGLADHRNKYAFYSE